MKAQILLVEDDPGVARAVAMALNEEGWATEHVTEGSVGLKRALSREHDLVILDVRLPGMNGFDICRELRRSSKLPVLFLTARGEEMDKVLGLELGGDDYLAKPFGVHELRARVRALLRRTMAGGPEPELKLRIHDLLILPDRRMVTRAGEQIFLTPSEYALLLTMARRPGMVFTREMLMDILWAIDRNTGSLLTVNVHMRNLRQKLGDDPEKPRYIATVRGAGYKLVEEEA